MEIKVTSIEPEINDPEFPKMYVNILIDDEKEIYRNTAQVHVFIDKRDVPVSEIAKEAISEAISFLKSAISSYS